MAKPKSKPVLWTDFETEYLWLAIVHAAQNNHQLSLISIAAKLGRTRESVQARATNLRRQRWHEKVWPKYDIYALHAAIKADAKLHNDPLIPHS